MRNLTFKQQQDCWEYYDDNVVLPDFWRRSSVARLRWSQCGGPCPALMPPLMCVAMSSNPGRLLQLQVRATSNIEPQWTWTHCIKYCRYCGQNFTCVLCVECFMDSEHQNHRFRTSHQHQREADTVTGDPETFISHHHISAPNKSDSLTSQQVLDSFPSGLE